MISSLLFMVPVHLVTVLFAIASASPEVIAEKLRFVLRISLLIGLPVMLVLAGGDAEDGLPAAASGSTPADALLLEQHDRQSLFGQVQRRRAAGDAAADHADIAVDPAGEGGPRRRRMCARRVVRLDVTGSGHVEPKVSRVFRIFVRPGPREARRITSRPTAGQIRAAEQFAKAAVELADGLLPLLLQVAAATAL